MEVLRKTGLRELDKFARMSDIELQFYLGRTLSFQHVTLSSALIAFIGAGIFTNLKDVLTSIILFGLGVMCFYATYQHKKEVDSVKDEILRRKGSI